MPSTSSHQDNDKRDNSTEPGSVMVVVHDEYNKDEESPAEYNQGGYLVVRVGDTFKDGRYLVLRKLGYVCLYALCGKYVYVHRRAQLGSLLHRLARKRHSVRVVPALFAM